MDVTELQQELSNSLLKRALRRDQVIWFEVGGQSESYIKCNLQGVEIYLYDDGFDIQGSEIDSRFEADDIASIDDARSKLLRELDALDHR